MRDEPSSLSQGSCPFRRRRHRVRDRDRLRGRRARCRSGRLGAGGMHRAGMRGLRPDGGLRASSRVLPRSRTGGGRPRPHLLRNGAHRTSRLPGRTPGLRGPAGDGEGRRRRRGRAQAASRSLPRLHRAVDPRDQDAYRRGGAHGLRLARSPGRTDQGRARPYRGLRGAGVVLCALHLARPGLCHPRDEPRRGRAGGMRASSSSAAWRRRWTWTKTFACSPT